MLFFKCREKPATPTGTQNKSTGTQKTCVVHVVQALHYRYTEKMCDALSTVQTHPYRYTTEIIGRFEKTLSIGFNSQVFVPLLFSKFKRVLNTVDLDSREIEESQPIRSTSRMGQYLLPSQNLEG